MIVADGLKGLAFPWVLIDSDGSLIDSGPGSLFPVSECSVSEITKISSSINDGGWAVDSKGYGIFRFSAPQIKPHSIIFHGLKITGLSRKMGKSETLSIKLSRAELEGYASAFCLSLDALKDQYDSLIRQNIHEVRGINSALKNSAFELQESLDSGIDSELQHWRRVSKSVVSLSELLSKRIDFMEFLSNPPSTMARNDIFVYRKFDKLQRCFNVTANESDIVFQLSGESKAAIYGPPIFDLVPYLLIENAVKYSPAKSVILISCNDSGNRIECSVSSIGPLIEDAELELVFRQGFRGKNALLSQKSGSGLGLAVLHKIVHDVFGGTINVQQDHGKPQKINNVPYRKITFLLSFPTRSTKSSISPNGDS
jgi:signal transduction histidine kinase